MAEIQTPKSRPDHPLHGLLVDWANEVPISLAGLFASARPK